MTASSRDCSQLYEQTKRECGTGPGQARGARLTAAAASYLDDLTQIGGAVKRLGRKVFPDHSSFLLREIALYSFIMRLLSGSPLALFFQASMVEEPYSGPYIPLKGIEMSAAMASTLGISFSARGGRLMRQVHHLAALLFNAAIGLRIADGVAKSIPAIDTYASFLFFGGEFPGADIVGRLHKLHMLTLPAAIVAIASFFSIHPI